MILVQRRRMLLSSTSVLVALLPLPLALLTACGSNGQIDPAKVVDAIKQSCGIAVVIASVADIIRKDPSMGISGITNLVCTGFKAAQATGKLGASAEKKFEVIVNGQPVTIELQ